VHVANLSLAMCL